MKKAALPILLLTLFAACKTGADNAQKQDMVFAPANTKSVKLKVTVLPTEEGAQEDTGEVVFDYPPEMSLYGLNNIDEVAAYGTAYKLWLGPRGWTGKGMVGMNGNVRVELYPPGGAKFTGPHVVYWQAGACSGCVLSAAGLFFPKALAEYNESYNQGNANPLDTSGYRINRISDQLITYTRSDESGLISRGVAYYEDSADKYFAQATFVLPADKAGLVEILQKQFIATLPH